MYKVVLVEENEGEVEKLNNEIRWEDYGYQIEGEAVGGEEGLQLVNARKPDLVILNTRLYAKSGLEIMEAVIENYPDILFLFVSGEASFPYAQKALEYGAQGYCLKPLNKEVFVSHLKRISARLDKMVEYDTQMYLEYMWNFSNDGTQKAGLSILNEFQFEKHVYRCVFFNGMVEKPCIFPEAFTMKMGYDKYAKFIEDKGDKNLYQVLKGFIVSREETSPLYIGISGKITEINLLRYKVRDAKQYAYQYFCQPEKKEHIFFYQPNGEDRSLFRELVKIMEGKIGRGGAAKAARIIEKMKEYFAQGHYMIEHAVHLNNIMKLYLYEEEEGCYDAALSEYDSVVSLYKDINDMLDQLQKDLTERELALNERWKVIDKSSNMQFQRILNYVNQNFTKDLSASQLGRKFYVNASYITQLFKKETSYTFSEYISMIRVEYSCDLLENTDLKVGEIAVKAGYHDYFYFSRVFKKRKSVSPSMYRREKKLKT